MNKKDLTKIALMGIASGALIATEAANAAPVKGNYGTYNQQLAGGSGGCGGSSGCSSTEAKENGNAAKGDSNPVKGNGNATENTNANGAKTTPAAGSNINGKLRGYDGPHCGSNGHCSGK